MKYECPDLDTLPGLLMSSAFIHKCAMRHSSRPPIGFGIKTFDQQDLIGPLLLEIMPTMVLVRSHGKCFPHPIRVYQLDRHQVAIRHGSCISHRERIFSNRLNRSPQVDDLEASSQKSVRFVWQMVGDSVGRGFVRLVDMDSLDGAAKGWRGFSGGEVDRASVLGITTNGVIEDEDF